MGWVNILNCLHSCLFPGKKDDINLYWQRKESQLFPVFFCARTVSCRCTCRWRKDRSLLKVAQVPAQHVYHLKACLVWCSMNEASCNIQQTGEKVGEAVTAQRLCVCVCERRLSFVTAGWWIHTFRNTTGRKLTQLQAGLIRTVTQTNTGPGTARLHPILELFTTQKEKHTHPHTQVRTHSGLAWCMVTLFELSPPVSGAHTPSHTSTLFVLAGPLELHGNTSLWQHCNLRGEGGRADTSNEQQPTQTQTGRVTVNVCNLHLCWDQYLSCFFFFPSLLSGIPRTLQNTPGQ